MINFSEDPRVNDNSSFSVGWKGVVGYLFSYFIQIKVALLSCSSLLSLI